MLEAIHPKLPMRDKMITAEFYIEKLGFKNVGKADYEGYLMLEKDKVQIHFFEFSELDPKQNYGQVYIRVSGIEKLFNHYLEVGSGIHPNGHLSVKPWGQKEFSILDPDNNLLTFGEPTY